MLKVLTYTQLIQPTAMNTSEKLLSARILTICLTISVLLIGFVAYDAYAIEIQQEVTEAVLNTLPDLDNSLAKL